MIRSMTAFARHDIKEHWGTATWELRSVNQRYLETYIRVPEQFRGLELTIRDRIRTLLTRGRVECDLCIHSNLQSKLILNKKLTKTIIKAAQWVKRQSNEGYIDLIAILSWPGVITSAIEEKQYIDTMSLDLLSGLDTTLDYFINAREKEGIALKAMIEQRLVSISLEITNIRKQMPDIMAWQINKILSKLEEANVKIDQNRQEQELVILAQKLDVSEELDRLEAHITETCKTITNNTKDAVGRRLDFMMQELYRESNTIASKSINTSITKSAIELKVLIEQMREQIQNIE
ncbi:YicC/YloC family endoribonuclease [Candidatus Palibaumannia cicadellinicola]|uniref:Protein YicC n=1 Tax=Candidatus Palibaumannia cicadellinicola TaxID=186490 RepID=A0A0K2BL36_9GAMM|nr:YicC/YloC family endoribonuclease [Candidatus Baumannia cicadellinicola]AKZ65768.1 Protein YicC [Candidatus Baumannia cicadellinicola]